MSLRKAVNDIARFSQISRLDSEKYGPVPADKELHIIQTLHYQITKLYPNSKKYLDMHSQKISYHLTKNYTIDGDMLNEYGVSIKMTESFMEKFSNDYPEGLI